MDELKMNSDDFYVVAVKDELTGKYLQPTFGEDMEALKRLFTYQINNNPVWKDNASDFSFYKLGYFNQSSGIMYPEIDKIISGHAVKKED